VTRAASAILGILLLAGMLAAESRAEGALCAPWVGEIDPLPSASDPDPLRAAWAELRADQLAAVAWKLEPHSRALAHRVWRHASCLDPERLDLVHALTRTAPVRWARPLILGADEVELREGEELPGPVSERLWDLGEPIRVTIARTPALEERGEGMDGSRRPVSPGAAKQIAATEKALREARFELALARAERARRLLAADGRQAERAELEVLAATAEIALGREEAARRSLERALRAQAELRLDPAFHSPKLVRLFEEVRSGNGPPR
jgi:hypothetical protein